MHDKPPKNGIPSWQLASDDENGAASVPPASEPKQQQSSDGAVDQTSSSEALIEQAKRFLTDEEMKDAPLEQKIAFLRSKGLSDADVATAIQATNAASATTVTSPSGEAPKDISQPKNDAPPIITYPEFLMQAQKPPPIITVNRLLNTAYAAAGVGAVIYGLSRYLVAPMTESLTSSRRDFAAHVQAQVDALNEKLQKVVSSDVQPDSRRKLHPVFATDDAASDTNSSNSDPTELFHRDYGTQTSPIEITASSPSSSSSDASLDHPSDPLSDQTSSLSAISENLADLVNDDVIACSANAEISQVVKVLDEYLDSLAYPSYTSTNAYGYHGTDANNKTKKEDDEINRMKAEIRSVKGVLLSARNFPGSTTARRPLYSPTSGPTNAES